MSTVYPQMVQQKKKRVYVCVETESRDFPGGPVDKTPHSLCRGPEFHRWSGN